MENREEIVNNTLSILSEVFNCGGMFRPNCAISVDFETSEVSYYHFAGNQSHDDNVFMIIEGHDMPTLSELNLEEWEGVNWADYGYDEYIRSKIEQYFNELQM